jgi:Homeodomain-like domain
MDMGEEARRLRVDEQLSISRIRELLGVSREQIEDWLRGVPAPDWTKRPNAKDELHARAVEMRNAGHSVPSIARELGVARSTAWQWTKHIPLADDTAEAQRRRAHAKRMTDARWARHRLERDEQRRRLVVESAGRIGALDERDLLLLGSVIYWCEGAKVKPWGSGARVIFINSDPRLILLFLRFLGSIGIGPERLMFRVHIHETADHEGAIAWWAERVGVSPAAFHETTLKRHNPKTNRLHRGVDYHGCLRVEVRKSSDLYWRIVAAVEAIIGEPGEEPEGETG